MNDRLLEDEESTRIRISRDVALVTCVANFLDLSRKVLRNIELGVPVVILSRTNTSQHCYRWAVQLCTKLKDINVDKGMVTFLSCSLEEQRRLMHELQNPPLYFTGGRAISASIK